MAFEAPAEVGKSLEKVPPFHELDCTHIGVQSRGRSGHHRRILVTIIPQRPLIRHSIQRGQVRASGQGEKVAWADLVARSMSKETMDTLMNEMPLKIVPLK